MIWIMRLEDQLEKNPGKTISFIHFLLTAFIFSPALSGTRVLVASTDNFYHMIPNTLFSLREIQNGGLGLWNPFILSGIDFSASTHNYLFMPLNWPLFFFPQEWFMQLFTLRVFIEVWMLGIFAYLVLREEVDHPKWALFGSMVFLLSGYTFFSLTTYCNTQLTLFTLIAIYLLSTERTRKFWLNFLLLTFCISNIFVGGNIVYGFSALLTILIFYLYQNYSDWLTFSFRQHQILISASILSALAITTVRWLPIINAIAFHGSRIHEVGARMNERAYLGLRSFIPETFGIHLKQMQPLIQFFTGESGVHAQFHGTNYFGVLPLMLIFTGLLFPVRRKIFWGIYLIASTMWMLAIPPVSGILDLIFYPIVHTIPSKFLIPFGVLFLSTYSANYFSSNTSSPKAPSWIWIPVSIGGLSAVSSVMLWGFYLANQATINSQTVLVATKVLVVGISLVFISIGASTINHANKFAKLDWVTPLFGTTLLIFLIIYSFVLGLFKNDYFVSVLYYTSVSLIGALIVLSALIAQRKNRINVNTLLKIVGATTITISLLCFLRTRGEGDLSTLHQVIFVSLGIVKFIILFACCFELLFRSRYAPTLRPYFFVLLCAVLLIDMLPFNRNYSRQVTNPFKKVHRLYPDRSAFFSDDPMLRFSPSETTVKIDRANYRVNQPEVALDLSWEQRESNVHSVYKIRSYGGVNSDVPPDLISLIRSFEPDTALHSSGIFPNLTHSRLLDILGNGYDARGEGNVRSRPTALARFMLFQNFEVISDLETAIIRMTQPEFVAKQQLVVNQDPGFAPFDSSTPAHPLEYAGPHSDLLSLQFISKTHGLVFFGDSFHPGWRARLNDQEVPIIRADFGFMAVAVPPGEHQLIFEFHPSLFYLGLRISIVALVSWCGVLFFLWYREKA